MTSKKRLFTGSAALVAAALTFAAAPATAGSADHSGTNQAPAAIDTSLNGVTTSADHSTLKKATPSTGVSGTAPASGSGYSVNGSTPAATGGAGLNSGSSESGLGQTGVEPTAPSSVPANDAGTGDRAQNPTRDARP